ncbi:MAG TPA: sugar phosphate isomerase/epimerase family protein [Candidatus Saccharimonadales bacterium]|nr:sugar phosphate isomerase/epimerase family protein [Candidatus Saccharimonadales bacterium]
MKLAVSNIAWTAEEEPQAAKKLQELGVRYVEIAPTKVWDDPLHVPDAQVAEYLDFWKQHGITVVAFQSMLFTRPDLKLFEGDENRAETLAYLQEFIRLAGRMDAGVLVFGSPKNRQRGKMPEAEATKIAREFFGALGDTAKAQGTRFCIEPNAPQYNCDFVTTADAGMSLVRAVHNPGFGLHLDIACMVLAGDDVPASIHAAKDVMQHFHISSPMLEAVADLPDVPHCAAAEALRQTGYDKFVSIEMKPGEPGTNIQRVADAVRFAQSVYTG